MDLVRTFPGADMSVAIGGSLVEFTGALTDTSLKMVEAICWRLGSEDWESIFRTMRKGTGFFYLEGVSSMVIDHLQFGLADFGAVSSAACGFDDHPRLNVGGGADISGDPRRRIEFAVYVDNPYRIEGRLHKYYHHIGGEAFTFTADIKKSTITVPMEL